MPTDYQSRLNEQAVQARKASGDASVPMPDKPDAPITKNPLTREEVQGVINSLVETIKKMVMAQESKFVTQDSLETMANKVLQTVYGRNYQNKQQALQIAKDAVPPSLYGLDTDETRKRGDTLKLIPGYPTGEDRAVWGEGATPFDWSIVSLGFTISGTTVTILTGMIDRIAVPQTDVTVADDNYVYVRRAIASDTMVVLAGVSVPADDTVFKYYRLYQFSVTEAVASLKFALRPFDIEGEGSSSLAENYAFAIIGITGTSVELQAGKVCKGTNAAVDVPSQSITVADGQTIYVVYTFATGVAALGVSNDFPIGASGTYIKALHLMTVTAGVASLNFTYHKGVVQIDGCYS